MLVHAGTSFLVERVVRHVLELGDGAARGGAWRVEHTSWSIIWPASFSSINSEQDRKSGDL